MTFGRVRYTSTVSHVLSWLVRMLGYVHRVWLGFVRMLSCLGISLVFFPASVALFLRPLFFSSSCVVRAFFSPFPSHPFLSFQSGVYFQAKVFFFLMQLWQYWGFNMIIECFSLARQKTLCDGMAVSTGVCLPSVME